MNEDYISDYPTCAGAHKLVYMFQNHSNYRIRYIYIYIYIPENPIDIAVMFTNVLNYGLTEPCSVLISPMASPFQTSSCH